MPRADVPDVTADDHGLDDRRTTRSRTGGGIATTTTPGRRHIAARRHDRVQHRPHGGPGGVGGIQSASPVRHDPGLDHRRQHATSTRPGHDPDELRDRRRRHRRGRQRRGPTTSAGSIPRACVNTNPQLATALDASRNRRLADPGDQPGRGLRRLRAAAPSISAACTRPQGARCDAGAYEFNPRARHGHRRRRAAVHVQRRPTPDRRSSARSTARAFTPCASPFDPAAAPGTHTLACARSTRRATSTRPRPPTFSFTAPGDADAHADADADADAATPVVNKTVVVGRPGAR